MKKIGISFIVVVLIVITYTFINHSSQKFAPSESWQGKTDDGMWEAKLYQTQEGSKKVYDGDFYWSGPTKSLEHVKVTMTQYIVNGHFQAGDKKETSSEQMEGNRIGFVAMTDQPKTSDTVQAVIHWKESHHLHQQTITLKQASMKE